MKRDDVAKELGVHPNTILIWEKKRISPVTSMRNERTGRLTYPDDTVPTLREWMNKQVPATFAERKE